MVSLQSVVQTAASVADVLTAIVFGVGHYFVIRLYREWVQKSWETRAASG